MTEFCTDAAPAITASLVTIEAIDKQYRGRVGKQANLDIHGLSRMRAHLVDSVQPVAPTVLDAAKPPPLGASTT
jgi:hypothetical protein